MPRLCGYCGGAIDSIISLFTQLHRSGLNLEFENFFSQFDTWLLIYGREKAKYVVASKNELLLFSSYALYRQQPHKRGTIVLEHPVARELLTPAKVQQPNKPVSREKTVEPCQRK